MNLENLTIHRLLQHYRDGDFTPHQLITYLLREAEKRTDFNSWIYRMRMEEIQPYIDKLSEFSPEEKPLYGIPFAIKDNIDLAGVPTTAACEAFAYTPTNSALVVKKLINAGAIPLGKTNLDQFATGLVGVRSPYGATRNAFNPDYISGGSSSGSAVVVAQGLVSFALGTDTAGSGRVPAAFNNIMGMKPSRGLVSNQGVVPACRSLDCVAIFATTTSDVNIVFDICKGFDPEDPYSRHCVNPTSISNRKFAVPLKTQLSFFGNEEYEALFEESIRLLEKLGWEKHEVDFQPFLDAASLLYSGPWVAERYLACQQIIEQHPQAMMEVTRQIIEPGKQITAVDAFKAQYQLQAHKQKTDDVLQSFDFLLTPTVGTIYTIDEVNDSPLQLNANLGYYTNFMNLLDYAAIAVPAGFTGRGLPFGVTLVSRAFTDSQLLAYSAMIQQSQSLQLGATGWDLPVQRGELSFAENMIKIVVCGAHMKDLPLNHQLTERNATFVSRCYSSKNYKLMALPGGPPQRPGMLRVEQEGSTIEVEVWQMPASHFGSFLTGIPHPLGLGKVELEDGSWETGFICEGYIDNEAEDISQFGGWRAYLQSQ